ncbi:hypothetical protein ACWDFL_05200 [Streptomyces bungoensis]
MSIQVVRTTDGWWVESGTGRLHRVDTGADTTAGLLADRSTVRPYRPGLRLDATRRVVHAELTAQGADCDPERILCRPHDGGVHVTVPALADDAVRRRVTAALDQYLLHWQYAPSKPLERETP